MPLRSVLQKIGFTIIVLAESASANAATASVVYSYDQLGRITTALYDNGLCIAYSYDANGNRTAQTNANSSTPQTPIWGTGTWGCFQWTSALAQQSVRVPGDQPRAIATSSHKRSKSSPANNVPIMLADVTKPENDKARDQ